MKLPQGLAAPTTLSFTGAADTHLLFMGGLVFLASIAALGTVTLLLLLAPLATLFLGRTKPRRIAAVSVVPAKEPDVNQHTPDGGATRLPPPALGDEAA